ncbi:RHS repeat-associated core domain-containing protein [Mucilaginibacter sp. dw_454]|uniref:endonuclease toxin domain-containing protein n=1 Tax=Mucilaginibacter sp. dw_454 TaxID=2720079 RepID=UPI001BD4C4FE|nr:RHS repeat-associated core domain-containing protein [Mucilaginibacter sp. dw_454]
MNIPQLADPWHYYTYKYDQLNRIKATNVYKVSTGVTQVTDYNEAFTYDGNGNILTAIRNQGAAAAMDSLTYNYNHANGRLSNNQLNYITNKITTNNYPYGLNNQAINNYTYDPIGNMTADVRDTISNINWTVYGKIQNLTNSRGLISYTYDPSGQRTSQTANGITTWYIRDAQGNALALYDNKQGTTNWKEQELYGSSRLGLWQPRLNLATTNGTAVWDTTGKREYELSNHLGNVLATLSDNRMQHSSNGTSIDYYNADVNTANEYYAFGGLMPGRTFTQSNNYRYGFNGKENDNEVKGVGNQQDYGMRIYDPRVGRFLSVDPLYRQYPEFSSYQFAGDNPIIYTDLNGGEPQIPLFDKVKYGDNIAVNAVKVVSNSSADLVNGGIGLVNSFIGLTHEIVFHPKNLPADFKNAGTDLYKSTSKYVSDSYRNIAKTPFSQQLKDAGKALQSPETYENTLVLGASLYTGGETAGAGVSAEARSYSIFEQSQFSRGLDIEGALGGNLPKNFPVIDRFANGVATSIKSIDLTAQTYQNASNLMSRLKGYVNSVAKFEGNNFGGFRINASEITSRELNIAIQDGKATTEQLNVLEQVRQYGAQNGVNVKITKVQ